MRTSVQLLACLSLAAPVFADGSNDITIDLGRGPVTICVPDAYADGTPAPLILLLHGYSSTGANVESWMQFEPIADEYGFLFAAPDGTKDFLGFQFWNATDACCDAGSNVDDSGYLRALIDEIKNQLDVDERRVYMVGHSNGGFMSYRMACDHADAVAAIASLAGATFFNPADCNPTENVHVLQMHGTNDNVINFNGGALFGVPYPGAVQSVETWATYAGCSLTPDNSAPPIDIDASIPGAETTVTRYQDACGTNGSGELWTITGGPHSPALVADFSRKVVEWLYAHPKEGLDTTRYCSPAISNSTGSPSVLDAEGSDSLAANDLLLRATSLPMNQFGYFLASQTQGFVSNPAGSDGNLCLGGTVARFTGQIGNSGMTGAFEAQIDLTSIPLGPPAPVNTGETWNFQAWHRDGGSSNFTDGLSILFR